jgi:hypothetical protein
VPRIGTEEEVMNRSRILVVLLVGTALLSTAIDVAAVSSTARQPVPELFEGTIHLIQKRHLTLSTAEEEHRIVVPGDALIPRNGTEATLEDLAPGMLDGG